jgi:hypothetical protein
MITCTRAILADRRSELVRIDLAVKFGSCHQALCCFTGLSVTINPSTPENGSAEATTNARASRVASQRMSMTRRASLKLREMEELKEGEQPASSPVVKQSASVFIRPAQRLSIDVERLKTLDIQIDANSFADKALNGTGGDRNSLSRRLSMRGLFSADEPKDQPTGPEAEEATERKVEGREIKQDHENYALTYGMMLGIRVMVRHSSEYFVLTPVV